jgi:hypothetical protein
MIGFSVGISEGGRHGTSAATYMRWRARHVDDRAQDHAKDFARKAGAQNWLDSEVTAKFATGTHIAPCAGPVTVADVYQSWFPAQAHISAKTAASRRSAWSGPVEPQWGDSHDLRHTAASLAISAGASVKAVQRVLGHAKASTTLDTYADLLAPIRTK